MGAGSNKGEGGRQRGDPSLERMRGHGSGKEVKGGKIVGRWSCEVKSFLTQCDF